MTRRLSKISGHLVPFPVAAPVVSPPLYSLPDVPQYPSLAKARVSNIEPDFSVPISFFDYDAWDRITKPAQFSRMGQMPAELQAEARSRIRASRPRVFVDTPIYNGRLVQEQITLDTAGCCCEAAVTQMEPDDFYDEATVHKVYFPECIEFVKRMTGATAVLPFDQSVRNKTRMLANPGSGIAAYQNSAHNDNTLWSGPKRARELLRGTPEFKEEVFKHRYAVMNVWKRWDGGNDMPLAICSGDSLSPEEAEAHPGNLKDMVGSDLVFKNRTGETYQAVWNPNQTFFWFPDMTKDESIILKIYDSESVGNTTTRAPPLKPSDPPPLAKWTLHTAFEHPYFSHDKGTEKECRQSMEVRCLVLWAPEELASQCELKGVTGIKGGGASFYDLKTGKYVTELEGASANNLEYKPPRPKGAFETDYSRFQAYMK